MHSDVWTLIRVTVAVLVVSILNEVVSRAVTPGPPGVCRIMAFWTITLPTFVG